MHLKWKALMMLPPQLHRWHSYSLLIEHLQRVLCSQERQKSWIWKVPVLSSDLVNWCTQELHAFDRVKANFLSCSGHCKMRPGSLGNGCWSRYFRRELTQECQRVRSSIVLGGRATSCLEVVVRWSTMLDRRVRSERFSSAFSGLVQVDVRKVDKWYKQ